MEPIKRQRKESDSVYTIMLIPHKGHEPRSIHFRLSLLKKVGIVCGLLCLLGAGVLFQSSHILYKAHQDQQELLTYRSEKAVQEQKIGQLLADAVILSVIVLMTGIRELILPMTMELRFMPARLALLKRLAGCPVMAVM